ncbi:MAG: M28 family peptidase [Crocinitomicaceae bacterium]
MIAKVASVIFILFTVSGKAQDILQADSNRVKRHLKAIVETPRYRAFPDTAMLNFVANYIHDEFNQCADSTVYQPYNVDRLTFKNVIASFGVEHDKRLIIGAHYDVCGKQDGADDNASGVVGLLELARLLEKTELNCRIDLVAYSLEEPPFFRSESMGSYVHAKYLFDNNIEVEGMICLEMIGYFNDAKKSQDYPLGFLKLFYGSRGDYITVVRNFSGGKFSRRFKRKMKRAKGLEVKSFQAPGALPGIDFSDHLNYWKFDYKAVMITNTGFYRNKNYHRTTDQISTLDIGRMTATIQSVYDCIAELYVNK